MKKDECTHLLVDKPEGQKYAYARRWQLTTVHSAVSHRYTYILALTRFS